MEVKVKESRNWPGVAQRVPGGLGSQIFMTYGTWRWWGRQPHAPAAFTPRNVPGIDFHYTLSRPQSHGAVGRNMSLKNPVTPPGIDPGTVWLVAQRLNHYATPGWIWKYNCKVIVVAASKRWIRHTCALIPFLQSECCLMLWSNPSSVHAT